MQGKSGIKCIIPVGTQDGQLELLSVTKLPSAAKLLFDQIFKHRLVFCCQDGKIDGTCIPNQNNCVEEYLKLYLFLAWHLIWKGTCEEFFFESDKIMTHFWGITGRIENAFKEREKNEMRPKKADQHCKVVVSFSNRVSEEVHLLQCLGSTEHFCEQAEISWGQEWEEKQKLQTVSVNEIVGERTCFSLMSGCQERIRTYDSRFPEAQISK